MIYADILVDIIVPLYVKDQWKSERINKNVSVDTRAGSWLTLPVVFVRLVDSSHSVSAVRKLYQSSNYVVE